MAFFKFNKKKALKQDLNLTKKEEREEIILKNKLIEAYNDLQKLDNVMIKGGRTNLSFVRKEIKKSKVHLEEAKKYTIKCEILTKNLMSKLQKIKGFDKIYFEEKYILDENKNINNKIKDYLAHLSGAGERIINMIKQVGHAEEERYSITNIRTHIKNSINEVARLLVLEELVVKQESKAKRFAENKINKKIRRSELFAS